VLAGEHLTQAGEQANALGHARPKPWRCCRASGNSEQVTEFDQAFLERGLRVNRAHRIGGNVLAFVQDVSQRVFHFRRTQCAVDQAPDQNAYFQSF
jgi:hypothetical protein